MTTDLGNNADYAEFASYFGFENPMFRDVSLEPAWVRSTPADLYFRRDADVSDLLHVPQIIYAGI